MESKTEEKGRTRWQGVKQDAMSHSQQAAWGREWGVPSPPYFSLHFRGTEVVPRLEPQV